MTLTWKILFEKNKTEIELKYCTEIYPAFTQLKSLYYIIAIYYNPFLLLEPDDSFFQVTIDDLRKRMSALKSDRYERNVI